MSQFLLPVSTQFLLLQSKHEYITKFIQISLIACSMDRNIAWLGYIKSYNLATVWEQNNNKKKEKKIIMTMAPFYRFDCQANELIRLHHDEPLNHVFKQHLQIMYYYFWVWICFNKKKKNNEQRITAPRLKLYNNICARFGLGKH